MRAIIVDHEAIQALSNPDHDKHRAIVAHLAGVLTRRRKGIPVIAVVPTTVRVAAGWNRSDTPAAPIKGFRVVDRIRTQRSPTPQRRSSDALVSASPMPTSAPWSDICP